MTETYSLGITGLRADSQGAVENIKLPDSACQGLIASGAAYGAAWQVMQDGNQILAKNPDGSQSWYTIDAERSTPGNIVLRPV